MYVGHSMALVARSPTQSILTVYRRFRAAKVADNNENMTYFQSRNTGIKATAIPGFRDWKSEPGSRDPGIAIPTAECRLQTTRIGYVAYYVITYVRQFDLVSLSLFRYCQKVTCRPTTSACLIVCVRKLTLALF